MKTRCNTSLIPVAMATLSLVGCVAAPAQHLLNAGKGIQSPLPYHAENINPANHNEFLACDRAFTRVGDLVRFAIPVNDPPTTYRYTGLGPFPAKAMHRYTLATQLSKQHPEVETYTALFSATFLREGQPILFDTLLGIGDPVLSMPQLAQDFATPPGADAIIIWVGVSRTPNILQPGPKLLFQSLDLIHRGPLDGTKANRSVRNQNLLRVAGFEDLPVGPYAPSSDTCAVPAGVAANIVGDTGRWLHLNWPNTAGPAYVRFDNRPATFANCAVEFTFRARGRGLLQPMIWFGVVDGGRMSYYGGKPVTLSSEWQTVRLWRACVSPGIESASAVVGMHPGTEVFVDDLELQLVTVPR